MADDHGGKKYVRGKLAKRYIARRSSNMRKINQKKACTDADHNYAASNGSEAVDTSDINIGGNVQIAEKPWFQGRRIVELETLAENMFCHKCNSWLRLTDIVDEVVHGLASYLYIKCTNDVCSFINLVPTGKRNAKRSFDVNSKAYLAMVGAGMGPSQISKFLTGCNIPSITATTLHKKEKELVHVLVDSATKSCDEAKSKELQCSDTNELEVSFDAGWQKRGSGWQYNSHTGHATLIGVNTGKIVDFDMRSKTCSICQYHHGRNETVPNHNCNVNWTGSSKAMEPDMACGMIKNMKDKGYTVGTLHADNDTTTQSRLPSFIKKKDDKTHVKKNLSSRLYKLSKEHKQLKSEKVIPYIVRCFMYTISKHQNSKDSMKLELEAIVPHIFGDHSKCPSSWCTYNKDPSKFRYRNLPYGKALSGDHLKRDLEQLAQTYLDRVDRLVNLGSTQANESFNNTVASFAPKNRFYGGSQSLKARLSSAVLQKNEGYGWLSKVNGNALLSPGQHTKVQGFRKDKMRKWTRDLKSTIAYKRKRIALKMRNTKHNQRETVKEGDTYGGEIELKEVDIEAIPSRRTLSGEEAVVVFDLETTGLSRRSDITQLAAYDGSEMFNKYVMPRQPISTSATAITGLSFDFTTDQMHHHGEPVNSEHLHTVLLDLIEFLRKKKKPILFGHNIAAYDVPILLMKLLEHNLLSEFLQHITGCIDTLKLSKRKFNKSEVGNFKQQNLVLKVLGKEYDAHNACADVKNLYELLQHLDYTVKDIFPLNASSLTDSFSPLLKYKVTKQTARRLAHCGLGLHHLRLAFRRDSENGIKSVLVEHGFNSRTIIALTNFFANNEE